MSKEDISKKQTKKNVWTVPIHTQHYSKKHNVVLNFNPSRYQKYNISKICTNTLDSRLPEYIVFGTVMFYKGAGGPRTQGGRGEGELEEGVEVDILMFDCQFLLFLRENNKYWLHYNRIILFFIA